MNPKKKQNKTNNKLIPLTNKEKSNLYANFQAQRRIKVPQHGI